MQVKDRSWSDSSLNYRFGFNGMEMDNEVAGEGNSLSTEYRMLDTRLGRWLSMDPVVHAFQSPYCAFDNKPIFMTDLSGADGTPNAANNSVKAYIFISSSTAQGQGVTQQQMDQSSFDIESNINDVYGQNGVTTDVNVIQISDQQMLALESGGNISLNGQNFSLGDGVTNAMRIGQTGTSYVTDGVRGSNNVGTFFVGTQNNNSSTGNLSSGNTAAHEFGHMLGLRDRYGEGLYFGGLLVGFSGRFTIPLELPELQGTGYIPTNNLMSSGDPTLDAGQLAMIFSSMQEATYASPVILGQANTMGGAGDPARMFSSMQFTPAADGNPATMAFRRTTATPLQAATVSWARSAMERSGRGIDQSIYGASAAQMDNPRVGVAITNMRTQINDTAR
jgi:RHS repeat-associated protein